MTLQKIYQTSLLSRAEILLLFSWILNKNRIYLLAHPETKITPRLYRKFKRLENKRLNHWPLAYLTGQKEFYGLKFLVNKNVLTPRPETELMIDQVLNITKTAGPDIIIDVGTGSGAIIITLAKKIRGSLEFLATDISPATLKMAKKNALFHRVNNKIKFFQGNLLEPIKNRPFNKKIIITANLPYLTPTQIKNSPSIKWEPKIALNGGLDGLKYYRQLLQQLQKLDYQIVSLLLEIDPGQKNSIKQLVKKYFPESHLEFQKDLARKNRLVLIRVN